MRNWKVGDEAEVLANPKYRTLDHPTFREGDVVVIISVEEYPAGSRRSRTPGCVVARLKGPKGQEQWVDMSSLTPVAPTDEEVEGAIRSITGVLG